MNGKPFIIPENLLPLLADKNGTGSLVRAVFGLASFMNKSGRCYPSLRSIVSVTGGSDKRIREALCVLVEIGAICRQHRQNDSCVYQWNPEYTHNSKCLKDALKKVCRHHADNERKNGAPDKMSPPVVTTPPVTTPPPVITSVKTGQNDRQTIKRTRVSIKTPATSGGGQNDTPSPSRSSVASTGPAKRKIPKRLKKVLERIAKDEPYWNGGRVLELWISTHRCVRGFDPAMTGREKKHSKIVAEVANALQLTKSQMGLHVEKYLETPDSFIKKNGYSILFFDRWLRGNASNGSQQDEEHIPSLTTEEMEAIEMEAMKMEGKLK